MSRSISSNSNIVPVSSGTQVVTPMYTDVNVTAGDYIYMYDTGTIGSREATTGIGQSTAFVAGFPVYGYAQNVETVGASYSPLYTKRTYTGTSQTLGAIKVAGFDITAVSTSNVQKCCILNNGNIVLVFRQSTALWMAIYSPTGAVVKAAAAIYGISVPSENMLAVVGMADGGFVVAFSSSTVVYYMRFSSTGGEVKGVLSFSRSNAYLSIAAFKDNSYIIFSNAAGGQLNYYIVSSSNDIGPATAIPTFTICNRHQCTTLDNGQVLLVAQIAGTNYQSGIINSSGVISKDFAYVDLATSAQIQLCTVAGGAAIAYRIDSTGYPTLVTLNNTGTSLGQVTLEADNSHTPGGICSGQNGQLFITTTTCVRMYTATFSVTAPARVVALYTMASQSISNASSNTYNALNGTNYIFGSNPISGFPRLATYNNVDLTQNVSELTGANYTPATDYYFLGVAINSVAAGGIVNVQTNGVATLPSTYPSVISPISFDYQNGNSPYAQRGTVSGRNIILKGLE